MDRPKFAIGEEVLLCAKNEPEFNGRCEILSFVWSDGGYARVTGEKLEPSFRYRVSGNRIRWIEEVIRKLPPEERTSWEDCEFIPIHLWTPTTPNETE